MECTLYTRIFQKSCRWLAIKIGIFLIKGEKNNGFDVLYHNMKHGVIASKELAEFLRERSAIEENNYKLLSKVAKQASSGTQGTFAPVWAALRGAAEKLAVLHLQMAQRVTELIKDVSKYADELHKKHKAVRSVLVLVNLSFLFASCCSFLTAAFIILRFHSIIFRFDRKLCGATLTIQTDAMLVFSFLLFTIVLCCT